MHKSTASRIVATLEARGLVEQDQHRGKYRLGLGILRLAGATTARLDIVQEARPIAKLLAERTGETINIAVLSDGAALYLDQVSGTASVQSHNWVGQRIPLHATSNGKVLLSGLSEAGIRTALESRLPTYTPHTVTSIPRLLTEIAEVVAAGFSIVIDELEVGLTAVSAPDPQRPRRCHRLDLGLGAGLPLHRRKGRCRQGPAGGCGHRRLVTVRAGAKTLDTPRRAGDDQSTQFHIVRHVA